MGGVADGKFSLNNQKNRESPLSRPELERISRFSLIADVLVILAWEGCFTVPSFVTCSLVELPYTWFEDDFTGGHSNKLVPRGASTLLTGHNPFFLPYLRADDGLSPITQTVRNGCAGERQVDEWIKSGSTDDSIGFAVNAICKKWLSSPRDILRG